MIGVEELINTSYVLLGLAGLISTFRIIRGPDIADRVVGADFVLTVGVGYLLVFAWQTKLDFYIDVAMVAAVLGFLATIAYAYFISLTKNKEE